MHSRWRPLLVKNPASSLAWNFPPLLEQAVHPGVCRVALQYCMYATAWERPVIFMSNDPALRALGRGAIVRGHIRYFAASLPAAPFGRSLLAVPSAAV